MSKWVLVIYIGFGNGGGPAVIELSDLTQCQKVGLNMYETWTAKFATDKPFVRWDCIPKEVLH
jgi:hypothetical protein